jgi:hypothetical protein
VITVVFLFALVESVCLSLSLAPLSIRSSPRLRNTKVFSSSDKSIDNQEKFENDNNYCDEHSSSIASNLDMNAFQRRKRKFTLQNRKQQWHQPPNPLLENPIDFVQAILDALKHPCSYNGGALCLLQASTPKWRRLLFNSVGAPSDATDDQVSYTLQNSLERPNNQFAILVNKIDEVNDNDSSATSICTCWDFPTDPFQYEEHDNEKDETIDFCFIESRLRSPKDDSLMVVVGWALQRRRRQPGYSNNLDTDDDLDSFWLLDGMDWQDFRDEFRPGIGREEWERICG